MKTNTWTTPRGAKIQMVTEHVTQEIINADGHKVTVEADRIEIREVTLNGERVTASLTTYQGQNVLNYGEKVINGTHHPLLIAIPANVYADAWGEYDARREAEIEAEIKAETKYQQEKAAVYAAMNGDGY